jgi:hypothetical protein
VNHPNLQNPFFPAGGDVVGQEVFHLFGLEGVKVQDPVNGKFQGLSLVHR